MVTQVVFDTLSPMSSGLPGTAAQIFTATTDQTNGVITTAGAVANLVTQGILKPFDILFINYDVDGTEAQSTYSVTATSGGTLVSYSIPAGYLTAAGNLAGLASPYAAVIDNLGIGYYFSFNVTVGQAALASGGHVALFNTSGIHESRIHALHANKGGTAFSGGGGDRLLSITDGTTVYSVIPATNLQTLVNSGWGITTTLPFPATAAINTPTAAGVNLYAAYSGGTTDYTAGSVVISGIAEVIA